MQCTKVSGSAEQLLDPAAAAWAGVPAEALTMAATPLANQPSEYIKASRDEKQIGKCRTLNVQSAHNGTEVFFRLSWGDESENDKEVTDTNMFPDGCGVLLPIGGGDAPIEEMGSKDVGVNAWFWRANYKPDEARNTFAHGLGSTEFSKTSSIRARGAWQQGVWTVVFTRPLSVPELEKEAVQLAAGKSVKVGFAVWEGGSGERAGVKSFSKEWRDLVLDA
ncbi:MAG: hypothetical protein HY899_16250 [Deltaproteobacteria bacterium]|nr:hypothetical protein [Deltaproteobacteria bacterium]